MHSYCTAMTGIRTLPPHPTRDVAALTKVNNFLERPSRYPEIALAGVIGNQPHHPPAQRAELLCLSHQRGSGPVRHPAQAVRALGPAFQFGVVEPRESVTCVALYLMPAVGACAYVLPVHDNDASGGGCTATFAPSARASSSVAGRV